MRILVADVQGQIVSAFLSGAHFRGTGFFHLIFKEVPVSDHISP